MLTIQPGIFPSKTDGLSSKLSPSFRSKRIPSAQDSYSSNQNLKIFKTESPSKFSEEIKRRKSHYLDNSQDPKKKREKDHSTQNIINSIQYLKDEYRTLKDAYRELITQKMNAAAEITQLKAENSRLKLDKDSFLKENQLLKDKLAQFEGNLTTDPANPPPNQSQFLSFSLTSMLDDSVYHQDPSTRRRKDHVKVLSDLTMNNDQLRNMELKANNFKEQPFKKLRREIGSKLQILIEQKECKPMTLKTPMSCQKKGNKSKNSKSKRKDEDKENTVGKNFKKKSKKCINLSGNE